MAVKWAKLNFVVLYTGDNFTSQAGFLAKGKEPANDQILKK
jgi:hypothetical protein